MGYYRRRLSDSFGSSAHTARLGFLLEELVHSELEGNKQHIVLLAEKDTLDMELELSRNLPRHKRNGCTIECRRGNPADHIDLEKCACNAAHDIYVMSRGLSDWKSDRATMRVVLALSVLEVSGHVIVELRQPGTRKALE